MADRFNSTSKELFSRVSVGEDDDGKTAEEVHGAEKKLDPKFDKPMSVAVAPPGDGEKRDWSTDISELKKELAVKARTKIELELELQKLEKRISLRFQNQISIEELEGNL
jgi:hypothetical protein